MEATQQQRFDSFLNKFTFIAGSTNFLDGYILAAIGPSLIHLAPLLQLDALEKGAIGTAALVGIFIGGPTLGALCDKVGRKLPFMVIPIAMIILCVLSMFVTSAVQLFIVRLLLGMVIGADYASVTSYLSEFSPPNKRGFMIGCLMIMWIVGMTLGEVVGYIVYESAYNWQILLGIPAIPALILAIIRRPYPESPRWLMNKGRREEAEPIIKQVWGPDADINDFHEVAVAQASYSELLKPYYLKRVLFAGIFWGTQVLPMYAVYIFGPSLLESFNLTQGKDLLLGNSIIGIIFVVGVVLGTFIIEKFNRRPLIIWSFVGMALGLLVFAVFEEPPFSIIVIGFVVYALASGPPNVLDWVYPNELFPTEIRAVGVGVSTMLSRVGPVIGTFGLPYYLEAVGIQTTMLTMVGVLVFGLIICILLAPETRGLDLSQTSGAIQAEENK